nr:protein FAM205A [Pogona vitticeps]
MQGAEGGCFACCWNLLLFLLACYFLRLWNGQFQALPAWRDSPRPPSQGQEERAPRWLSEDPHHSPRSRRRRSIRRLLCDDPSCSLCQQVAEEAAELAYPRGPGLGVPLTRASQRESTHSSVSSTLDSSFSSWTQGSISSSGCSVSLRSIFSWSLQVESEEISSFSESTRRSQATRKGAHRKSREGGCRHCRRRHRRKGRAPAFQGVALETPFLGEEARASLEGHLLRKQVQHALGLPATLLRSLRAFMPLAPNSVARSAPRSPVLALCPQPLPFLKPHGTRAELEKHLKKMVHLRRWRLERQCKANGSKKSKQEQVATQIKHGQLQPARQQKAVRFLSVPGRDGAAAAPPGRRRALHRSSPCLFETRLLCCRGNAQACGEKAVGHAGHPENNSSDANVVAVDGGG